MIKNLFAMLVICFLFYGCDSTDCTFWHKKADVTFKSEKFKYLKDSLSYSRIMKFLDIELSNLGDNFQHNYRYSFWNKDYLQKISSLEFRKEISIFFAKNKFDRADPSNKNIVLFYPEFPMKFDGEPTDCPSFHYTLAYVRDDKLPTTKSPNHKCFKVAKNWYLITSVNSL